MFDVLSSFSQQIDEAIEIGNKFDGFPNTPKSYKFVVLGMGGSAIGGDLLNSYLCNLKSVEKLDISTSRNYNIPNYVDDKTNVIVSSYSGTTEETLSAFNQAIWKTKNIIAITTGGNVKKIADENSIPLIIIPSGFQPRCAIAYSFFPMLMAVMKSGLIKNEQMNDINYEISNTQVALKTKSNEYSNLNDNNIAIKIANEINGTIPIIYTSSDGLESVGTRWVRQIQENAKHLAFNSLLPEMNHNEINSFSFPLDIPKKLSLVFIQDSKDNPRNSIRFKALSELLSDKVKKIINIKSKEQTSLSRMFDLIYLGDWISFYLAILNGIDPTPIPLISRLKEYLSKF